MKAAAVGVAVLLLSACGDGERKQKGLVIGKSTTTTEAAPAPTIPPEPEPDPTTTTAEPVPATSAPVAPPPRGFPDGHPYGPAIAFHTSVPVPQDIISVLVIGGDARPGGDPRRSNGDSIHLLIVDPRTGAGTVVGFPRDSWVQIPGKGTRKINSALPLGGPQLMAETVRHLTGLPVHYYVLTAFEGFERLVNDLGGVQVEVDRKMADKASGAFFDPGWHDMDGTEALAYARNRKDTPAGDFSRSLNQGNIIMSGLAKLRAEVADDAGIQHWINVLLRHVDLDSPPTQLRELVTLARTMDPAKITNLVLPGRVGTASRQSVVFLGDEARRIFLDLRPDAAIGGPSGDEPRPEPATASAAPDSEPQPIEPAAGEPAEQPEATEPSDTTTTTDPGLIRF